MPFSLSLSVNALLHRKAYISPAAMACCPNPSASSPRLGHRDLTSNLLDDEGIEFEKRSSNLHSVYANDSTYNEHRVALEDWSKQYEVSERNLGRKQANCSSARSDLYQILGLFFVFQGVILTAVAQANLLRCHNWILPFFLCLLTSIAAFGASLQKLKEISEFTGQFRLERAHYISLHKSIERLKEEGTEFNVRDGQPELKGPYTESELSGKGTFDNLYSSFSRFCSVWIISYAGCVLLVLFIFSGLTLFSIHQILCNPGRED